MNSKNYAGFLAIANPNNPVDGNEKSVILIANHNESSAVGIRVNRIQQTTNLSTVAHSLGIHYYRNDPIYEGGDRQTSNIHIIHSLDWYGLGTVALNDEIGITTDISILAALAKNDGPEYFKACAGYGIWGEGVLERQLSSVRDKDDPYKFEIIPATVENLFFIDDEIMWETCIQMSIINKVKEFSNLFLD